jgi:hypothetical protein
MVRTPDLAADSADFQNLFAHPAFDCLLQPGLVHTRFYVGASDQAHEHALFAADESLHLKGDCRPSGHDVGELLLADNWTELYWLRSHAFYSYSSVRFAIGRLHFAGLLRYSCLDIPLLASPRF